MRTFRFALVTATVLMAITGPMLGERWVPRGPTGLGRITDVAIAGSTAYAASPNGVFRSEDGGETWQPSGLTGEWIYRIVVASAGDAVLATTESGAFVSRDGGQSWRGPAELTSFTPVVVAADPAQPSTFYAATVTGMSGMIARSTDGGTSWELLSAIPGNTIVRAFAFDGSAMYVLTELAISRSTDGGESWTPTAMPKDYVSTIASGRHHLYATGGPGAFCRSSDGAATWACSSFPAYVDFGAPILELPGEGPRILVSSADGLFLSGDGGATWEKRAGDIGPEDADSHGIACDESGSLVLAGTDSHVVRSSDRGETWTAASAGLGSATISALALGPGDSSRVWAGIQSFSGGPKVFRSTDAGLSWSASSLGSGFQVFSIAIDPVRPSMVYAAAETISLSDDGGASWRRLPSSVPAARLVFDAADPPQLWATTSNGVARYGGTWSTSRGIGQYVHSLLFDRQRTDTVYAGSYNHIVDYGYEYHVGGSIFVSYDGGDNFTKQPTVFGDWVIALAQDALEGGALYAATYRNVSRSVDGGASWQDASTGLPPSVVIDALVADPVKAGTLYAGTSAGVFRSIDGARSWVPFSGGLGTRTLVTQLVIAPDGGRLYAGTYGSGVFELNLETADIPSFPCVSSATRLCLIENRYAVELTASRAISDPPSPGVAHSLGDRSGYFGLPFATGDPDLPEVFVKMLPAGAFGGSAAPVFYASLTTLPYTLTVTDTLTGNQRVYASDFESPLCGRASLAFAAVEASSVAPRSEPKADAAVLELLGGRFSVTLEAVHPRSRAIASGATMLSGDRFGIFSLPAVTGDAAFPEVVVKMVDGRATTGKFWFFHTGLTSLDYTLTVTDSVTGAVQTYTNPAPFCGAADTKAFTDAPPVALDLNGAWWVDLGDFREIQVHHSLSSVTFEWGPYLEFRGTLGSDGVLAGRLILDGYWRYDVSGIPTSTRIELSGDGYSFTLTRSRGE